MTTNSLLSVTVELDPSEYPADDLGYHRSRLKRTLETMFPGAAVSVRAGQFRWWDSPDGWSVKA